MRQAILPGNMDMKNYTVLYDNDEGANGNITLIQPYTNFVRIGGINI